MTKVLQIVNRLNLGGITYNAATITAHLRPEHETMIVAGMKEDSEESSEFMVHKLGLVPIYLPDMHREINLRSDYKAYKHLLKIIREFKPDVVHTHAAKAGLIGRLAAKRAGVKVIVHTFHGHVFHSYFGKLKTAFFINLERYLAWISSAIIAISENQKRELCEKYKISSCKKIHLVELGYDLAPFQENQEIKRAQFRDQYSIQNHQVAIGIIGRLVPIKNLKLFIEAFSLTHQKIGDKTKAFIIGDGEQMAELQEFCKTVGLPISTPDKNNSEAPLVFTSWIHEIDIAMNGIDILAISSLNEGTPASLIEAQAAGKPIVATNVGGISNIVIEGETALLVESGDITGFSNALNRTISDESLRSNMSNKGPSYVLSRFHEKRLCKDISDLYAKLLKN
ncbi:MAG: glycosyltransferase [Bacteroidetes bacterium]|nr:glycosyltransferase [Bacteroidota bacterium]